MVNRRQHPSRGSTFTMHHQSYIRISFKIRENQTHPQNPIKTAFACLAMSPFLLSKRNYHKRWRGHSCCLLPQQYLAAGICHPPRWDKSCGTRAGSLAKQLHRGARSHTKAESLGDLSPRDGGGLSFLMWNHWLSGVYPKVSEKNGGRGNKLNIFQFFCSSFSSWFG